MVFAFYKEMLSYRRPQGNGAPPRRPEPPKSPRSYEEVREAARHYGPKKVEEIPPKLKPPRKK